MTETESDTHFFYLNTEKPPSELSVKLDIASHHEDSDANSDNDNASITSLQNSLIDSEQVTKSDPENELRNANYNAI